MTVDADGMSVTLPGTATATFKVPEVPPDAIAPVKKLPVPMICPFAATYATSAPVREAPLKPVPVRVRVVELVLPVPV